MDAVLNLTTFDATFDHTFQGLTVAPSSPIAADPCRVPGVYLGWESHKGWAYYLFRGNADTDYDVKSAGQFEQAGAERDTQRIGRDQIVVRAGGLTRAESDVIKSIYLSVRVYAIAPDLSGKIKAVLVRIDEGSYATWRDSGNRINIEFKINFPKRKGQRA